MCCFHCPFFTKIRLSKVELPQNVQLFFFGLFVISYVDWVLLHRKMLKTLLLKCFFTKKIEISEKNDFSLFSKNGQNTSIKVKQVIQFY